MSDVPAKKKPDTQPAGDHLADDALGQSVRQLYAILDAQQRHRRIIKGHLGQIRRGRRAPPNSAQQRRSLSNSAALLHEIQLLMTNVSALTETSERFMRLLRQNIDSTGELLREAMKEAEKIARENKQNV